MGEISRKSHGEISIFSGGLKPENPKLRWSNFGIEVPWPKTLGKDGEKSLKVSLNVHPDPNKLAFCDIPGICNLGVSENVVYPFLPNGFADHYPVFKWLFHWEYTLHFQTNPFAFCRKKQRVLGKMLPAEAQWPHNLFCWCARHIDLRYHCCTLLGSGGLPGKKCFTAPTRRSSSR